jgi:hypothetical protein
VGLGREDEHEDFYNTVILWWLMVNPAWRKEGVTNAEEFKAHGLVQCGEDNLEGLPSGLNGLTSILAYLVWWYRIAGFAEGTPRWKKLVEDIAWVLREKHRVLAPKRGAPDALESPRSKCFHIE